MQCGTKTVNLVHYDLCHHLFSSMFQNYPYHSIVISPFSILYTFTLDTELSHTAGFEFNAINCENTGKLKDCWDLSNHGTLMKVVRGSLAESWQSQTLTLQQNSYDICYEQWRKLWLSMDKWFRRYLSVCITT
jgi:hypothetical protein